MNNLKLNTREAVVTAYHSEYVGINLSEIGLRAQKETANNPVLLLGEDVWGKLPVYVFFVGF